MGWPHRENATDAMRHLPARIGGGPTVVLVGLAADAVNALADLMPEGEFVLAEASAESLPTFVHGLRSNVVVLYGPGVKGSIASALIAGCAARPAALGLSQIVVGTGPDVTPFQDLVDQDLIFYLATGSLSGEDLVPLIRRAVRWRTLHTGPTDRFEPSARDIQAMRAVLGATDLLNGAEDLPSVAACAAGVVAAVVSSTRAYCVVYEAENETLRSVTPAGDDRVVSAASGLASYVVRSGCDLLLERGDSDPRYDRHADDPVGTGVEQFLLQPVGDSSGATCAVLVAVRSAGQPTFNSDDRRALKELATHLSGAFARVLLHLWLRRAAKAGLHGHKADSDLFRREAVQFHDDSGSFGRPLDLRPGWVRPAYAFSVAVVVLGVLLAVVGRLPVYASGPAVVFVPRDRVPWIEAVIPASHRARIAIGDSVQFQPSGYSGVRERLAIAHIGEIIADPRNGDERIVPIRGELPTWTFSADGRVFGYFDGMPGNVRFVVQEQRLIGRLFARTGIARTGR